MNWYNNEDWYAPAKDNVGYIPEAVRRRKRAKRKKWTVRILVAAAILGILGAGIGIITGAAGKNGSAAKEYVWPDTFRAYMDSIYGTSKATTTQAEYKLETVEYTGDFRVEAVSSQGLAEKTINDIYDEGCDSIVAIKGFTGSSTGYTWGSGVILSEDGLVLTNSHVVEDSESVVVVLSDDTEYDAVLIGGDSISDLAVLKIEAEGLVPAQIGVSDELDVGDTVVAIGNPLSESFRLTMTDGIVSGIDRGVSYNGQRMTLIQTNAAINNGNSGGALYNRFGQVVGITNMKMRSSYSTVEGIGFAIPSKTVMNVCNMLLEDGKVTGRTSIGITAGVIPQQALEHYGVPEGLYVSAVNEGTDAERKGILPGDIITQVNGEGVTALNDILQIKEGLSVGDTLTMTIWRDGASVTIDVELSDTNDIYN